MGTRGVFGLPPWKGFAVYTVLTWYTTTLGDLRSVWSAPLERVGCVHCTNLVHDYPGGPGECLVGPPGKGGLCTLY